jgi:hypothetical protein
MLTYLTQPRTAYPIHALTCLAEGSIPFILESYRTWKLMHMLKLVIISTALPFKLLKKKHSCTKLLLLLALLTSNQSPPHPIGISYMHDVVLTLPAFWVMFNIHGPRIYHHGMPWLSDNDKVEVLANTRHVFEGISKILIFIFT